MTNHHFNNFFADVFSKVSVSDIRQQSADHSNLCPVTLLYSNSVKSCTDI